MRPVIFLTPAEEEMLEAASHYNRQVPGLGLDFLTEVQETVARIIENPELGTVLQREIRRWLVRRFPFGVLYRIDEEEIIIVYWSTTSRN